MKATTKTTDTPIPDGRCPDCMTARIPPGVKRCHACGLMVKLGCPMSPYVPSERKGAGT